MMVSLSPNQALEGSTLLILTQFGNPFCEARKPLIQWLGEFTISLLAMFLSLTWMNFESLHFLQ
jgi:hypothetical protein